nr:hypothetical protein [Fusarium oxysporum]
MAWGGTSFPPPIHNSFVHILLTPYLPPKSLRALANKLKLALCQIKV